MERVQECIEMARQAAEQKAHVAVAMNYRTAADLAESDTQLAEIVHLAADYAANLKKPMDRRAMYEWGQEVIVKRLPGNPLEDLLTELIEQSNGGEKNANTTA